MMKQKIITLWLLYGLTFSGQAQPEAKWGNGNLPIIISLQFHSLALPFKHLGGNFKNIGIGLGTEIKLNERGNAVQQLSAVWYHNKAVGNGILLYTQSAWRPGAEQQVFGEAKAGLGYTYAFRPTPSYKMDNGKWVSVGHKGKGMLTIPIGLSAGYNTNSSGTSLSPFISYQFLLLSGYNKSVPLIPETLIQMGSRVLRK
jgi:hypothetical protein